MRARLQVFPLGRNRRRLRTQADLRGRIARVRTRLPLPTTNKNSSVLPLRTAQSESTIINMFSSTQKTQSCQISTNPVIACKVEESAIKTDAAPNSQSSNRPEYLPVIRALVNVIIADDSESDPDWKKDTRYREFMALVQTHGLTAMISENVPRLKSWRAQLARCREMFRPNVSADKNASSQSWREELAACRELIRSNGSADEDLCQQMSELVTKIEEWYPYTLELMKLLRRVDRWLDKRRAPKAPTGCQVGTMPQTIYAIDKADPTKPPIIFRHIAAIRGGRHTK